MTRPSAKVAAPPVRGRDAIRWYSTRALESVSVGAGLHHDRLGRRSLLSCRRARRLGAGCRRAHRGESLNRAATHRPARGTPRGADVREAALGLSFDECGRGGPPVRGADGGVVESAGDASLWARPGRTRTLAGDTGAAPRDALAHARLRRVCAASPRDRDGDIVHW